MAVNRKRQLAVFLTILFGAFEIILQRWLLQRKISRSGELQKTDVSFSTANRQREAENKLENELKLVLFYTSLFGRRPWPGLVNDHNFTNWNGIACRQRGCKITYNRSDFLKSDAVLFHGRDLPSVTHMKNILRIKPPKQRWIYFMHESPQFSYFDAPSYNGFFNWTMTYRRDSDFFVPYRFYTRLEPDEIAMSTKFINYAEGKDKVAVFLVSHCGELRDKLVRKLMKYINVDIFGSCSKYFNQTETCPKSSLECSLKLQRYKFLLAFENSFCNDYITEKYWYISLDHSVIPVVMGGASYENEELAIPGSFINVADFESVEALAIFLLRLNSNDTAYNEYFRWKRKFKPMLPESWTCKICSTLHNDSLPAKVYNMEDFWGIEKNCGENEEKVYKLIDGDD